uniref:VWFA domain-containing protein n=1 Tax=Varanus komodoensis TaxID=61221 RepID=A0A8D2LQC3_VARKO
MRVGLLEAVILGRSGNSGAFWQSCCIRKEAALGIGLFSLLGAPYAVIRRIDHLCQLIFCFSEPADAVNMSLGLSLVARDSQVLVCGPTVHRACGNNMYLKGYCFLLDQNLHQLQHFPENLPECTSHPTDIVFLIDGSSSINDNEFKRMKTFVSEVITKLSSRNTQFALAQFSHNFQEHFNFSAPDPARHVMEVSQIEGVTFTPTAIRRVVKEIFVPHKGSRKGATKILLVITDGRKNDVLSYEKVIEEAEEAGIIRYAIGVSILQGVFLLLLRAIKSSLTHVDTMNESSSKCPVYGSSSQIL